MAAINSDWGCHQNLGVDIIHKIYRPTSIRLVILFYHWSTFNKKKKGLCGCTTAVFALRRKKLGCQKTLQNFRKICLLSLQNFAFWMQNLRLFLAKNRRDRIMWQYGNAELQLTKPRTSAMSLHWEVNEECNRITLCSI